MEISGGWKKFGESEKKRTRKKERKRVESRLVIKGREEMISECESFLSSVFFSLSLSRKVSITVLLFLHLKCDTGLERK